MKNYEFFPHTADAKFQAYGKTLEEAFENAAYAMTDIITDHTKLEEVTRERIKISSENTESLLYDFLEQLIILLDTKKFMLHEVKDMNILEKKNHLVLTATVLGDNRPGDYAIKTAIKAVTYQEMFVKRGKDGWVLQVVVDI